ncbi:MAG: hypothetical protein RII27_01330, partial [Alphaproteobacteria bacterium]
IRDEIWVKLWGNLAFNPISALTLATRRLMAGGIAEETASLMAAALNRFVNSPLKRRHTLRTAHQARAFVAEE